jgi:hypothetical protein
MFEQPSSGAVKALFTLYAWALPPVPRHVIRALLEVTISLVGKEITRRTVPVMRGMQLEAACRERQRWLREMLTCSDN